MVARVLALSLMAMLASASSASAASMVAEPAATCAGLVGAAADAVRIDTAELQAPSALSVSERAPTPSARIAPANPAFCRVLGHIEPVDPKAPPIRFEVNLPVEWN